MTETTRIRWQEISHGNVFNGYVGTLEPWAFQVWQAQGDFDDVPLGEWVLSIQLPGSLREKLPHGDDPESLKAEAERWLARFVASLGASFPETRQQSARIAPPEDETTATTAGKD